MLYSVEVEQRHSLHDKYGSLLSWKTQIGSPEKAKILTKWFIQSQQINQFSLARKLLYNMSNNVGI